MPYRGLVIRRHNAESPQAMPSRAVRMMPVVATRLVESLDVGTRLNRSQILIGRFEIIEEICEMKFDENGEYFVDLFQIWFISVITLSFRFPFLFFRIVLN